VKSRNFCISTRGRTAIAKSEANLPIIPSLINWEENGKYTNACYDSKILGGFAKKSVGVSRSKDVYLKCNSVTLTELLRPRVIQHTKSKVVLYIDWISPNYLDVEMGGLPLKCWRIGLWSGTSMREWTFTLFKRILKQAKKLLLRIWKSFLK